MEYVQLTFVPRGHVENLGSRIRQNYHKECEEAINKQINLELQASNTYLSMAYYFDRDDVALKGFYSYFKKLSNEERNHAESLMKYQNKRGGQIILQDIKGPVKNNWLGGLEAMEAALEMEKSVNQSLIELYTLANSHGDVQLCDYLGSYLHEQVDSIVEISKHITNLKRVGIGLGKYLHDKHGLHSSSNE
ncbi:soma ferritin-like isoform X1 [Tachypleus tridentatus]|uniref:soma ferritin-like isoform X1 n=1 Tax=Tachypleus tridentatus TaxID=6853 RepID=UPI003FD4ADE6